MKVNHWIKAYTDQLPPVPLPADQPLHVVEMDELHTFIGQKKSRIYLITLVERRTSYVVGWRLSQERDPPTLQQVVDSSPQAVWYYSDRWSSYRSVLYTPGTYTPMPDKSKTYRVEGVNAELRHYLARLARASRCFSRYRRALERAIKLFVFAWNRWQLYRQRDPDYLAHLMNFVYP